MKKFTKAWDTLSSCPIDINSLPKTRNGLSSGCTCVECHKALEACQGDKRSWYFRHANPTNCKGGPMSALHLMAQYLLTGDHILKTRGGEVPYSNGAMEYCIPGSRFKADVTGVKEDGSKFLIEIFVTHKLGEEDEKVKFIRELKIHAIEIDLRKTDPDIGKEELLDLLLNDIRLQRVIYSPPKEKVFKPQHPIRPETKTQEPSLIEGLAIAGIAV